MTLKSKEILFSLLTVVVMGSCIVIYFFTPLQTYLTQENLREFKRWVLSYGFRAPLVFILLYGVALLVCVPASVLNFLGGLIFGTTWGTVLDFVALQLTAYIAYGVSRVLGREILETYLTGPIEKFDSRIQKHGVFFIVWLRWVPFVPYAISNYMLGLTSVKMKDMWIGNTIGMLPWCWALASLGHATAKYPWQKETFFYSWEVLAPMLFMVFITLVSMVIKQVRKIRKPSHHV